MGVVTYEMVIGTAYFDRDGLSEVKMSSFVACAMTPASYLLDQSLGLQRTVVFRPLHEVGTPWQLIATSSETFHDFPIDLS